MLGRGCDSVIEHQLYAQKVLGSTPDISSRKDRIIVDERDLSLRLEKPIYQPQQTRLTLRDPGSDSG